MDTVVTQCCVKNYAFQMFLRNAAYCGVVLRRIAILLGPLVRHVSRTTENPTQSFVDYVDMHITKELRRSNIFS